MVPSFFGRNEFFNYIAEEQYAYLIVITDGGERHYGGHFGYEVFFSCPCSTKQRAGAYINQQHYRQFAFFFKHLAERMIEAGRYIPVDKPDIVAGLVFAH